MIQLKEFNLSTVTKQVANEIILACLGIQIAEDKINISNEYGVLTIEYDQYTIRVFNSGNVRILKYERDYVTTITNLVTLNVEESDKSVLDIFSITTLMNTYFKYGFFTLKEVEDLKKEYPSVYYIIFR